MKPVFQTILPTEENPMQGNCFPACIASILEIPIEEVPDFCAHDDWEVRLEEWLEIRRLVRIEVRLDVDVPVMAPIGPGAWCILCGETSRHPTRHHAVVGKTATPHNSFHFIHDPHPSGEFLKQIRNVMFIVPMCPAKALLQAAPREAAAA